MTDFLKLQHPDQLSIQVNQFGTQITRVTGSER